MQEDPSEAMAGVSRKKFIQSMGGEDTIDDKYSTESRAVDLTKKEEDKRDLGTIQREEFLNIYKEADGQAPVEDDTPDLSEGIKIRPEDNVRSEKAKPLI